MMPVISPGEGYSKSQVSVKTRSGSFTYGFKSPEFPVGTSLNVMITHVTSPQYFHCQGTRYAPTFGQLADKIHMHYSQLQPEEEILMLVSPGQPCIAQYSMDKSWYRAKVNRELTNNIVEVFFIDYGNIELVPKHLIKVTKPEFMEMPAQGIPCCLHGVTNVRSYWSPEHIAQFEDLVLEQFFTATVKAVSSTGIHAMELSKDEDVCINLIFGQLTNSLCLAGNDEDDDDDDEELQCDPSLRSVIVGRDRSNLQVTVASESRNSMSKRISPKGRSPVKNGRGQRNLLPNVNGSIPNDSYANLGYQNYKLNVGDSLDICMIFLISPQEFWCQPVCMGNALKSLMKELNENHCDNAYGTFRTMPPSQTPCLAKFTDDGMWYRAEIVDIKQDQAAVFYVDYGNAEILPFSQLRTLPHRFIDVPTIAVKCSLNLPPGTIWSESQINALQDLALDHRVTAKVLSCLQRTYVLELFDPLSKKNLVSIVENTNILKPLTIANGTTLPVVISWVNSPDAFWLQLVSNEHQLEELVQNMQDYYNKLKERYEGQVSVGTFVVAQFSEDSAWYRAVVEDIFTSNVRVRFVDFGNAEISPVISLKPLVPAFTRHCCQAVCSRLLDIKPISFGEWGQDAKLFLENIEENVMCTFTKQVQNIFHVELKLDGVSIAEKFFQLGLAAIVNVKPQQHQEPNGHLQMKNIIQTYKVIQPRFDKPTAVVVSYYTCIFDFWCQLVGFSEELNLLMDSLAADGKSLTLSHIKPGDLVVGSPCIAKNSENETWYRALVLDIQQNSSDVLFVDYGNTERVVLENIRQLTSKYMQLPRLASHCKLSDVYSHLSIVNGVFSELVLEKSVQAKFLNYDQTTEIYEVDLIVDQNMSIVAHLEQFISNSVTETPTALHQPDTLSQSDTKLSIISTDDKLLTGDIKEVSVSYVYTPECFYVQFLEDDDEIEKLADGLNSEYSKHYWLEKSLTSIEVGMFCCAKYYLDDQWYRAVIVDYTTEDASVRFIDYGNQERVSLQGIKPLAEKFHPIPFLAYKFSLANVMPIEEEWSRNACDLFEDLVFNKTLTIQNIGQEKCVLIDNGDNIASLFIKSGCAKNLITESAMLSQPSSAVVPPKSYLDVIFEDENIFEAKDSMPDVLFVSKPFTNTAVPSEKVQCRVTNITDCKKPGIFYIRLAAMEEQYSEQSKKLCCQPVNYCGPSLKINTLCSVFNPNSCNLCRGVVVSVKPNLLLDIKCIDTGEYLKDVPASSVLNITAAADTKLTTLPPLAVPCTLNNCQMWNERLQSRFSLSTHAKSLVVSFKSKSKPYLVELYSLDGQLLADTVANQVPKQNITESPNIDDDILQPLDLLQFECLGVYLTHLVTPENFWCQPEESVVSLKQLEKEMSLYCSNCDRMNKAMDLRVSSLCVVRSAKDGKFYRGKVQSLKKFSCDILLVDFGNTETVERKSIWPMPKDFIELPMQAFECHLAYVEGKNNSWSQNSFSIFQNLCLNQLMTAEVCSILQHSGGTGYVINLTLKGKDVAELLVEQEIAEVYDKVELSNDIIVNRSVMDAIAWLQKQPYRRNLVCGELLNIQICSVVSQQEFWIKMFPKVPIVDKLKDLMEEIYQSLSPAEAAVSECQIGVLYAAVIPDETVYRAILKTITNEVLTVFDIDCGLTKVVNRDCLKELFPFIADLPPLAIHCEIAEDPSSESLVSDAWTGQMKVKECKEENLYVVSLLPAEVSTHYCRYLEPIYKPGFSMEVKVCFTTNPQDFWCQSSDSFGLDSLMNQLQIYQCDDIIPTAEICAGLPCLAKYSEDGALYRAEVLSVDAASSSVDVIFCDYGNVESVMMTELMPIPERFLILPKQALHSSLAEVTPKGESYWDEDMCTGFEEIVSEKVFTMSILTEMVSISSTYMVNLKDGNDKPLQEILIECGMASGLTAQMFVSLSEETAPNNGCGESYSDLQSANHQLVDNKSRDNDSLDDESQDLHSLDTETPETDTIAFVSPETEANTFVASETETHTYVSPETESHTYVSPETDSNTIVSPETESNTIVSPETESNTIVSPETESNTIVSPETESNTIVSPETESNTIVSPETESNTIVSPETESNTIVSPETEINTFVSSETESNVSVTPETETHTFVTPGTETNAFVSPETESNTIVSPETESNTIVSPETESNTIVSPETESNTIVSPETESNTIVSPETETNTFVSSETESNVSVTPETETHIFVTPGTETNAFVSPETESKTIVSPETETNKFVSPETEANALVSPKTETHTSLSLETETNTFVSPETETHTFVSPDTEANTFVYPETEATTFVYPETEATTFVYPETEENTFVYPETEANTFVSPETEANTFVYPETEVNTFVSSETETHTRVFPETETHTFVSPDTEANTFVSQDTEENASVTPETEANTFVYPETEANTFVYPETEANTFVYPETEANTFVYPETEANTFVYPETEANTFVYPETEANTFVYPETEANTFVYPETETNTFVYPETETNASVYPETEANTFVYPETEANAFMSPETETNTFVSLETETNTFVSPETETHTCVFPETEANTFVYPETETHTSLSPETETHTSLSPETEANTFVYPETEANTFVSPETEANTFVSSETETNTFVSSETETNTFVYPETEATTFVYPETEANASVYPETEANTFVSLETEANASVSSETDEANTFVYPETEANASVYPETDEENIFVSLETEANASVSSETDEANTFVYPETETNTFVYPETEANASVYPETEANTFVYPETEANTFVYPETEANTFVYPETEANASVSSDTDEANTFVSSETETNTFVSLETETNTFVSPETEANTFVSPETEAITSVTPKTETAVVSSETETNTFVSPETETNTFVSPETEANTFVSTETETHTCVSPETEANTFVSPETEANTFVSTETETHTCVSPETEANTFVSPETEANTFVSPKTETHTFVSPETETNTSVSLETEVNTFVSSETEANASVSPETEATASVTSETEANASVSPETETIAVVSPEVESTAVVSPEVESTLHCTDIKTTENEDSDLDVFQDTFDGIHIPNYSVDPHSYRMENLSTDNSEGLKKSNGYPPLQDGTTKAKQCPDDQNMATTTTENCPAEQDYQMTTNVENYLIGRICPKFTEENLSSLITKNNSDFNSNLISPSQTTADNDEAAESSINHRAENSPPAELETNRSLDMFDCSPSEWEELDQDLSTSLVSNYLIKPKGRVSYSDSRMETILNPFADCQTVNLRTAFGDMEGDPLLPFLDWHMEISNHIKVRLLNFIAPDDFYVTPSDNSSDFLQLSTAMNNCIDTLEPFSEKDPIIGLPCLVEVENSWQRGIIKSNESSAINVFFVDIGKELLVERSVLKKCPPSLYKPPAMSIHCFLVDVLPLNSSWSTTAFEIFTEFTDSELLEMRIDVKSSIKYGVYLYKEADDDNLNDRLIDLGHAIAEPGSKLEANREIEQTLLDPHRTSHMESDDDIQECLSTSLCEDSIKDCITGNNIRFSDFCGVDENLTSDHINKEQFDEEKTELKNTKESDDEPQDD